MLVIDTNVLSELMRSKPAPQVAQWVDRQRMDLLFTTVVSKAEILAGIAKMPTGRRRQSLESLAFTMFGTGFRDRLLPFDDAASVEYAQIAGVRRLAGRPIGMADLFIAAIARTKAATVVTRDMGGFELTGVDVINPWDLA